MAFLANMAFGLAKLVILVYTGLTYPIYALFNCPCFQRQKAR